MLKLLKYEILYWLPAYIAVALILGGLAIFNALMNVNYWQVVHSFLSLNIFYIVCHIVLLIVLVVVEMIEKRPVAIIPLPLNINAISLVRILSPVLLAALLVLSSYVIFNLPDLTYHTEWNAYYYYHHEWMRSYINQLCIWIALASVVFAFREPYGRYLLSLIIAFNIIVFIFTPLFYPELAFKIQLYIFDHLYSQPLALYLALGFALIVLILSFISFRRRISYLAI